MAVSPGRYRLDGTYLEACSCASPCPCLGGGDPDGGHCEATIAYHIDAGNVTGVDVSGLTIVSTVQIPGNARSGNWRQIIFVDDRATDPQRNALVEAFSGKLGGSLAELATLVGNRVGVHAATIEYSLQADSAALRVSTRAAAAAGSAMPAVAAASIAAGATTKVMARLTGSSGAVTTIDRARCAIIPVSRASLDRAPTYEVSVPEHQMSWSFSGQNGVHGTFHAES